MANGQDVQALLQQAEAAYRNGEYRAAAAAFAAAGRDAAVDVPQVLKFAHALTEAGAPARAESMLQGLMRQTGRAPAAMLLAAHAAARQHAHGRALALAAAAERLDPALAAASEMVFQMLLRLGAATDAIAALRRAAARQSPLSYATVNDLCAVAGLTGHGARIPQILEDLPPPAVPDGGQLLLFVGMAKSGGATIAASIAARLDAGFAGIGADLPDRAGLPAPWLPVPMLDYFDGSRTVLLSHAAALAENRAAFRRFPAPLLVHLRDPRDALVSLFEMGEAAGGLQLLRFLRLQPDYVLLSRAERLSLLRQRVYPLYLRWIEGWLRHAEAQPGAVRFSTYESFLQDPAALVDELAQACGAPASPAAALTTVHFRRGRSGSHREAFDAATARQMFDEIPAAARARFGWRP